MAKHVQIKRDIEGNVTESTEFSDETAPTKAIVGSTITVVVSFLGVIIAALDDQVISPVEWLQATVTGLVSAGLVFGGVYVTTNKMK
jgi:hypothetical protein